MYYDLWVLRKNGKHALVRVNIWDFKKSVGSSCVEFREGRMFQRNIVVYKEIGIIYFYYVSVQ